MNIIVNGKTMSVNAKTVQDLIRDLNLETKHLVVELNSNVLKQENWTTSFLRDGDKIEIIQFVAGG